MEDTKNETQTDDEKNCPDLKQRFELLIRARNFHYENYSKWMTYFYVAISALFIAFFTISSKSNFEIENKAFLQFTLLTLAYIISLLWYWSSKGYYYWNINFICMVNYYETEVFKWKPEERIYKVFYDKSLQNNYGSPISGANISTSKIAILFAFIITNFWGFLLFYLSILPYCNNQIILITFSILLTITVVTIFSWIFPKFMLYSKNDDFPEIKNKN